MSEKKSKLKKILIPIIIVVLIAIAVCLFFVFKAKNNNKNNNNPVENVNSNSIESEINSDIINQKISPEYNGNYIFQAVMHIELDSNLSIDELNKTYKALANNNVNVKDANTYYSFLSDKKNYNKTKEIITLVNGKYTKSIGSKMAESGLYFGNLNKSAIYKKDNSGSTIINNTNYSLSFEISLTGYWLPNNLSTNDGSIIYVREKVHYGNVGEKFVYITYAYKMIDL